MYYCPHSMTAGARVRPPCCLLQGQDRRAGQEQNNLLVYIHNTEGRTHYQDWLASYDFTRLYLLMDVNKQVDLFVQELETSLDMCFIIKATRSLESEPP